LEQATEFRCIAYAWLFFILFRSVTNAKRRTLGLHCYIDIAISHAVARSKVQLAFENASKIQP